MDLLHIESKCPTHVRLKSGYSQSTDDIVNNDNSSQLVNNLPTGT